MARTKAEKRAAKQRKRSSRAMYGDFRQEASTVAAKPVEDPRSVVISARRRNGARTDDDASRAMMGEPAGMAIAFCADGWEEADRLWDTFKVIDAADHAYASRFIGIRRFPNVSRMELLPERLETRADDRIDTRSEADKDRDTVSQWMRWQGFLGRLGRDQHSVIVDGMRQRARLVHAGKATKTGAAFVAAMRALDAQYPRG